MRAGTPAFAWIALGLAACAGRESGDDGDEPFVRDPALDDVSIVSAPGESKSHENGENCMRCHSAASDSPQTAGPGVFSVAASLWTGSVDDLQPLVGAVIQLRTEPFGGGDIVAEIPADALGNAYTTEPLDFFGPIFPHVAAGDEVLSMPFETGGSGACNMCHFPGGIELILP